MYTYMGFDAIEYFPIDIFDLVESKCVCAYPHSIFIIYDVYTTQTPVCYFWYFISILYGV